MFEAQNWKVGGDDWSLVQVLNFRFDTKNQTIIFMLVKMLIDQDKIGIPVFNVNIYYFAFYLVVIYSVAGIVVNLQVFMMKKYKKFDRWRKLIARFVKPSNHSPAYL